MRNYLAYKTEGQLKFYKNKPALFTPKKVDQYLIESWLWRKFDLLFVFLFTNCALSHVLIN